MSSPEAQTQTPEEFDVLDLFSGPGGLDVAAHFLGLTSIGIELDGNACETRYRAGLPTIHADVTVMREKRYEEIPHTKVLAGGPPCQSFSIAGSGAGRKALAKVTELIDNLIEDPDDERIDKELADLDPRTGLVLEPLRYLLKAITSGRGPYQTIVLEQVPAVYQVWKAYERVLTGKGLTKLQPGKGNRPIEYAVDCDVLRTEEYGVPQTRKRAVLVARLKSEPGASLKLPDTTHLPFEGARGARIQEEGDTLPGFSQSDKKPDKMSWRSMHAALKEAASELADSHDAIPRDQKFYVVSNYGSGGDPKKRGIRHWDQPSFTVTGKVSRNRPMDGNGNPLPRFTIHEAGVLQSFPGDFPWSGNDQAQQVGNAVPPLFGIHVLGAAIGRKPYTPDSFNLAWGGPVDAARIAELRTRGCGHETGCPSGHPHDQSSSGSSSVSRPRTGTSVKRSAK
ncbi:DNA cytosine methyltransferase [Streptomyces avermitilis]|uniref:DNA cytosine methyltransferase n=1 Tax=Streptomyces avermitilis TaxID=33903 RepID=UPI00380B784F